MTFFFFLNVFFCFASLPTTHCRDCQIYDQNCRMFGSHIFINNCRQRCQCWGFPPELGFWTWFWGLGVLVLNFHICGFRKNSEANLKISNIINNTLRTCFPVATVYIMIKLTAFILYYLWYLDETRSSARRILPSARPRPWPDCLPY